MKALVVYESMYGNTRHIAQAIGEGLALSMEVRVVPVSDAEFLGVDDVQFVAVGAPTHAWSLSRRRTRESAAAEAAKRAELGIKEVGVATGVREWLRELKVQDSCRGAAFDTRLDRPKLFTGSAVGAIERGLRAAGFSIFSESESFRVRGATGPLAFGEIERAREWGEAIGRVIAVITELDTREEANNL